MASTCPVNPGRVSSFRAERRVQLNGREGTSAMLPDRALPPPLRRRPPRAGGVPLQPVRQLGWQLREPSALGLPADVSSRAGRVMLRRHVVALLYAVGPHDEVTHAM
jgi:hypothetical protein